MKPRSNESSRRDGSSARNAIDAAAIHDEYKWVKRHYPGHAVVLQRLTGAHGKFFDVLTICSKSGKMHTVYFDVSSFFGKNT
jgi:hypothetical protein